MFGAGSEFRSEVVFTSELDLHMFDKLFPALPQLSHCCINEQRASRLCLGGVHKDAWAVMLAAKHIALFDHHHVRVPAVLPQYPALLSGRRPPWCHVQ